MSVRSPPNIVNTWPGSWCSDVVVLSVVQAESTTSGSGSMGSVSALAGSPSSVSHAVRDGPFKPWHGSAVVCVAYQVLEVVAVVTRRQTVDEEPLRGHLVLAVLRVVRVQDAVDPGVAVCRRIRRAGHKCAVRTLRVVGDARALGRRDEAASSDQDAEQDPD